MLPIKKRVMELLQRDFNDKVGVVTELRNMLIDLVISL